MDTIHLSSSDEIRERLNALEDAEIACGNDFETWKVEFEDERTEIIREVRIDKLHLTYVNDGAGEEAAAEGMAIDAEHTAARSYALL